MLLGGFAGVLVLKTLVIGVALWEGELWAPPALLGLPVLQSQAARSSLCSGPTPCLWRRESTARLGEEPYLSSGFCIRRGLQAWGVVQLVACFSNSHETPTFSCSTT